MGPGPRVAAPLGGLLVLTCGATGCEAPSFSWRTRTGGPLSGQVRSEGPRSTLTLSPVGLEDEHSYLCTVTCGRRQLEEGVEVDVYCECCPWRLTVLFSVPWEETRVWVCSGKGACFRKGSWHGAWLLTLGTRISEATWLAYIFSAHYIHVRSVGVWGVWEVRASREGLSACWNNGGGRGGHSALDGSWAQVIALKAHLES